MVFLHDAPPQRVSVVMGSGAFEIGRYPECSKRRLIGVLKVQKEPRDLSMCWRWVVVIGVRHGLCRNDLRWFDGVDLPADQVTVDPSVAFDVVGEELNDAHRFRW